MLKRRELTDLLISWLTLSFAFAWIGIQIFSLRGIAAFIDNFVLMLIAVGVGFIFHELSHKFVAQRFGAHAEFRAWNQGLLLAVALAVLTNGMFTFAAPGAVYVMGHNITMKKNALISLAGPITNVIAGAIFMVLYYIGVAPDITHGVAWVNFFLGAFNMLPIYPLDGSKVFSWNPLVWSVTFIPMLGIAFGMR